MKTEKKICGNCKKLIKIREKYQPNGKDWTHIECPPAFDWSKHVQVIKS